MNSVSPAISNGAATGSSAAAIFSGEFVLLGDLRVAPAPRTVELQHQIAGIGAELVDAILVEFSASNRPSPSMPTEAAASSTTSGLNAAKGRAAASTAPPPDFLFIMRGSQHTCEAVHGRGSILVTGGAGYIGSHVVLQLRERGESVVVLDDLSRGFRQSVGDTPLVVGNVGDPQLVTRVLRDNAVDTVLHFAAFTIVPESVRDPLKYYANNVGGTRNLLQCCAESGVRQFVFSSSAAVYGTPAGDLAAEDSPNAPINPYGTSKLICEWMLRDLAAASDLRYVALRYFNVAGSDMGGRIGQATPGATLLIKVASEASVGKRPPHVSIFGTDYPTPDGTGVRDYIHVEDLAGAHLSALDYLRQNGASAVLNCGYGHGYSVREVLNSVQRVSGRTLTVREETRRAGDPAVLVARAERIRSVLGWTPKLDDLDTIVRSSLNWEAKLLREPW